MAKHGVSTPMSSKYVRAPRIRSVSINYNDAASCTFQLAGETVFEDLDPVDTGLVDASGTPLYRVKERVPLGFHRRTER